MESEEDNEIHEVLEVNFEDFNEDFQTRLLEAFEIETPDEMGWDEGPVTAVILGAQPEDE